MSSVVWLEGDIVIVWTSHIDGGVKYKDALGPAKDVWAAPKCWALADNGSDSSSGFSSSGFTSGFVSFP